MGPRQKTKLATIEDLRCASRVKLGEHLGRASHNSGEKHREVSFSDKYRGLHVK
jgi:hypothetical protein